MGMAAHCKVDGIHWCLTSDTEMGWSQALWLPFPSSQCHLSHMLRKTNGIKQSETHPSSSGRSRGLQVYFKKQDEFSPFLNTAVSIKGCSAPLQKQSPLPGARWGKSMEWSLQRKKGKEDSMCRPVLGSATAHVCAFTWVQPPPVLCTLEQPLCKLGFLGPGDASSYRPGSLHYFAYTFWYQNKLKRWLYKQSELPRL